MKAKSLLLCIAATAAAFFAPVAASAALQGQNGVITALNTNLSSGAPTPGSTVACGLGGVLNSLAVGVQGSYSATLVVQITADGANWITLPNNTYTNVSNGSTGAISGSGLWTVPVAGVQARVTCSAFTGGSVTVSVLPYAGGPAASGGGGSGGSVTQGTNPWVTAGTPWSGKWLGTAGLTTTITVSSVSGRFGGYMITNLSSAPVYVEVFDTTGTVTLGTTSPSYEFVLPANATSTLGLAANVEFSQGLSIGNGIQIAAVTSSKGSTAVATGSLMGTVLYR